MARDIFKLYGYGKGLYDVISDFGQADIDNISLGLLGSAGLATSSTNVKQLVKNMDLSQHFIMNNANYFFLSLGDVYGGKSLYQIDYELSQSKKPDDILYNYKINLQIYFNINGLKDMSDYYVQFLSNYEERREQMFAEFNDFTNLLTPSFTNY